MTIYEEGVIRPNSKTITLQKNSCPDFGIFLHVSGRKLLARHFGVCSGKILDSISNEEILNYSSPKVYIFRPSDIIFYMGVEQIAALKYKNFFSSISKPQFFILNYKIEVKMKMTQDVQIWSSAGFEMQIKNRGAEGNFKVYKENLLYPCIAFLEYFCSVRFA